MEGVELISKMSFMGSEMFFENVGVVRVDVEVERYFVCLKMEFWFWDDDGKKSLSWVFFWFFYVSYCV